MKGIAMKRFIFALLLTGLLTSPLFAQTLPFGYRLTETDREIYEKLEQPFQMERSASQTPDEIRQATEPVALDEALKQFKKQTGIEIFIDYPALRECNVTPESPVKFRLPCTMPTSDVLTYLLKQHKLAYVVKNEVLYITSGQKAKGEYFSKAYYVGDLLLC